MDGLYESCAEKQAPRVLRALKEGAWTACEDLSVTAADLPETDRQGQHLSQAGGMILLLITLDDAFRQADDRELIDVCEKVMYGIRRDVAPTESMQAYITIF